MPGTNHGDGSRVIVDLVLDPVVVDADPVPVLTDPLLYAVRSRVVRELSTTLEQQFSQRRVDPFQVAARSGREQHGVRRGHSPSIQRPSQLVQRQARTVLVESLAEHAALVGMERGDL